MPAAQMRSVPTEIREIRRALSNIGTDNNASLHTPPQYRVLTDYSRLVINCTIVAFILTRFRRVVDLLRAISREKTENGAFLRIET